MTAGNAKERLEQLATFLSDAFGIAHGYKLESLSDKPNVETLGNVDPAVWTSVKCSRTAELVFRLNSNGLKTVFTILADDISDIYRVSEDRESIIGIATQGEKKAKPQVEVYNINELIDRFMKIRELSRFANHIN